MRARYATAESSDCAFRQRILTPKSLPPSASSSSTVQSALQEVKGVKEVDVSLEKKEAVVKYDSDMATVKDLIKAVKNARGMHSYDAKVKEK